MNGGFLEQQHYLEDLSRQPLRLIYCQQMDETSPLWNYALHSHPCLELICFLSGDLTINRGEDQLDAGASSVVVHPPQVLHQEFPRPEGRREVIALWLDGPGPSDCGSFQAVDRDGTLRWLFQHIHAEHRRHSADARQLIDLYLPALLVHLARACGSGREDALALATRYLRENYSTPVTLSQLAAVAAVSPSYLNRLFRRQLHTTPTAYLRSVRIQAAQALLLQEGLTVEEVARQVGIGDLSYFWRLFRRATGLSPSDYRRRFCREAAETETAPS